jgi:hypothetical protein
MVVEPPPTPKTAPSLFTLDTVVSAELQMTK